MSASNELRVFISSTFRDLHDEREHLVKKIFPEIRALCRNRGVTFTDVDLRWGLTDEQAAHGTVIRTCLDEIDKCHPYFIGIIGSRYGWIPEYHEIMIDPDLVSRYPIVEELALDGASVTEMEFVHALFASSSGEPSGAFFYKRNADDALSDDAERIASLVDRIRTADRPFREFKSIEALGEMVRGDLVGLIDREWPSGKAPSPLEMERRAHAAFAASRVRAYIPNTEYLKRFNQWVGGTTPLVVSAPSGMGKSSLVAYLIDTYRKKNPNAFVIQHYVGASPGSGSAASIIRHIVEEIRTRFDIQEEAPSSYEQLEKSFPNWLFRGEQLSHESGTPLFIALDAVNQLSGHDTDLSWVPKTIPSGIKFLVSTTPGQTADGLVARGWEELVVEPLHDERVRQGIVIRYLGEFHKRISAEQVRRVTDNEKAISPLYLRVVAEELRLHGGHETLDAKIDQYVHATDLLDVFDLVLERIESDHGLDVTRDLMSCIWTSRFGLGEPELMEINNIGRLELSQLLFAFDYHLLHREGVLGFFHDYLRRAVERRYLADPESRLAYQERIASYFEKVDPTLRSARELLFQLRATGDTDRLVKALTSIPIVIATRTGEAVSDVLEMWSQLAPSYDAETLYRESVDRWCAERPDEYAAGIPGVSHILMSLGRWDGMLAVEQEMLERAIEKNDLPTEAQARRLIGGAFRVRGDLDRALEQLKRAHEIYTHIGDQRGVAFALGNIGSALRLRGDYEQALECQRSALRMFEEFGDREQVAGQLNNLGQVYMSMNRADDALDVLEESLQINRKTGNRAWEVNNLGNMGVIFQERGESDRALECFRRGLQLSRQLGHRRGEAQSLAEMGNTLSHVGNAEEAIECYQLSQVVFEELGDRLGTATILSRMARVYGQEDRTIEAATCNARAVRILVEAGSINGLSASLAGLATGLLVLVSSGIPEPVGLRNLADIDSTEPWNKAALKQARACALESLEINRAIPNPELDAHVTVVLARLDAAEGKRGDATDRFHSVLSQTTIPLYQAQCHYWLWKLELDPTVDHRGIAEAILGQLPDRERDREVEWLLEEIRHG